MRMWLAAAVVAFSTLVVATAAPAQASVEIRTSPRTGEREFEVMSPGAGPREVTRPREADFYREDIRVRHEPGFIEPFTMTPKSGPIKKIGLSGWTAPPGRGDGIVQQEISGWFGFGISLIWE